LEEAWVCKNLLVLSEGKTGAYGSKENIFERPCTQRRSVDRVQNFSRAQAVSSDWVEATDWGCTLRVIEPMPVSLPMWDSRPSADFPK